MQLMAPYQLWPDVEGWIGVGWTPRSTAKKDKRVSSAPSTEVADITFGVK